MRVVTLFILFIIFASCNKQEIPSTPIDSEINVEFREKLEAGVRKFTLFCKTAQTYPCINYSILTSQHFKANQLDITFKGIAATELCFTAIGPATIEINLPALGYGVHELRLNTNDFSNTGKLVLSEDKADLLFSNLQGVSLVRTSTRRVPANTYWGNIGYHTQATAPKVEAFLQQVADMGVDFEKQVPGHYYYYEIDANGDIITNTDNAGYYFVKAFLFRYSGEEQLFRKKFKELAASYFDEMYIYVETDRGDPIYNWN